MLSSARATDASVMSVATAASSNAGRGQSGDAYRESRG
jgi:hypothetical protein